MTTADPAPVNASIPFWVKALLALAAVAMAAGLIMPRLSAASPSAPASPSVLSTPALPSNSFSASSPSAASAPVPASVPTSTSHTLSPAIFRLGFSFVVGFCIAYALRWAIKAALLVAGVLFLILLGLQYSGLVNIQWGLMEKHYHGASTWLSNNSKTMTTFVTGALPSAGAAGLGLFSGLRRKI